jgi:hypothetical protein
VTGSFVQAVETKLFALGNTSHVLRVGANIGFKDLGKVELSRLVFLLI